VPGEGGREGGGDGDAVGAQHGSQLGDELLRRQTGGEGEKGTWGCEET
jgi:hypothetical protein